MIYNLATFSRSLCACCAQTAGGLQLSHETLFVGGTSGVKNDLTGLTSELFPGLPDYVNSAGDFAATTFADAAVGQGTSRDWNLPVICRQINTHNQLKIKVLKTRVLRIPTGGGGVPSGQHLVEMTIPYKKKVQFPRVGHQASITSQAASAIPLGRDIAVVVTPVVNNLATPTNLVESVGTTSTWDAAAKTALKAAAGALGVNDMANAAGLCYIASEFYFKDA